MKMKSFRNVFLIMMLMSLGACSAAGWSGYYQTYPQTTINKNIAKDFVNNTPINFSTQKEMGLAMPSGCSLFGIMGFITPFTPPIPLFWFRSWSNQDCNYFTISTKPQASSIVLKTNSQTFTPEIIDEEKKWGGIQYKFPIKASKIDSGILVIEKDGEKIEVPFEYKYFKFLR